MSLNWYKLVIISDKYVQQILAVNVPFQANRHDSLILLTPDVAHFSNNKKNIYPQTYYTVLLGRGYIFFILRKIYKTGASA